jgi:hypothetical protein
VSDRWLPFVSFLKQICKGARLLVNTFRWYVTACLLLICAPLALFSGCGGGADAGTAAITGVVTVDDKPIAQASVAFIGNEGARLASASTDASGKFKIRAALGKNVVTVAKAPPGGPAPPPSDEPQLMPSAGEYAQMQKGIAASEIPAKYGDPKTSGLSFDITPAMKTVDVVLTSKP